MEPDIESLQPDGVDDLLREGIAAAKAGQRERARELLMRVVDEDERNANAWLWLSGVVESLEDREVCLENVLTIEPDNIVARRGLAWIQQQKQQAEDAVVESPVAARTRTPVSPAAAMLREGFADRGFPEADSEPLAAGIVESPVMARAETPVSPASAMLREDFAARRPLPRPKAEPSPVARRDEFDDEYLCPYCAAKTEPEDRRCKSCGGNLWIRFRKQEKRSRLLWTLIGLQVGSALSVVGLLAFLKLVFGEALGLLAIYRLAALLSLPSLFSLALAVGSYLRWRPVYYLLMADSVIGVALAIVAFAAVNPIIGVLILLLALGRFALILQLGGDFEWDRRRILFRLDPGLKSSIGYMTRADDYSRQKMWGLAAIHVRAALGMLPDRVDCHKALLVAYTRLKRYDLAARALEQGKRLAPDDPQLAEMEALLDGLRFGDELSQVV